MPNDHDDKPAKNSLSLFAWCSSCKQVLQELQTIRRLIVSNAAEINAKVDALNGKVDGFKSALTAIRDDIAAIKASLPSEGSMSAADVQALSDKLDAVNTNADAALADAQQLDGENPGSAA